MPSLKREEEYQINHQRYSDMKKGFKTSLLMALIPSAGVWLALTLYYFIRTLAMLAGGSAFFGQMILNYANGTNEKSDLAVEIPYLYMAFLIVIAILTFISIFFKKKQPIYPTFALYGAGALYGLISLIMGSCGILTGLYFIAYGGYGIWISDYILRLFKEKDYLSKQEGYPDFIVAIDEPRPMANTSGLHYNKSEYIKRQQKEKKEKGETSSEEQSWEMEDLPLDAELPKGTRKIDNMM
ncbi:MAG: hypothetical protein IJZ61_04310 [Oscillospiraceae bacterium]|nr:hypothetical protein [Oscillospiraceae bacterium]